MIFKHFTSVVALVAALFIASTGLSTAQTLKKGNFSGASGVSTSGGVSIVKKGNKAQIVISGNFKTRRGPGLYVYLGNGSPSKNIGKLRAIKGGQSYALPASVDISKYKNVYIYCKPFRKTFGKASLR
ncbi:MAG: DM13 domain-containing protein [Pseudomonadota bacterium]